MQQSALWRSTKVALTRSLCGKSCHTTRRISPSRRRRRRRPPPRRRGLRIREARVSRIACDRESHSSRWSIRPTPLLQIQADMCTRACGKQSVHKHKHKHIHTHMHKHNTNTCTTDTCTTHAHSHPYISPHPYTLIHLHSHMHITHLHTWP